MIYYDNAATTPPINYNVESIFYVPENCEAVSCRNLRFRCSQLVEKSLRSKLFYGNPSSPHSLGLKSEHALINARETFSSILNCDSSEIIFTSGGTESNNLAILGTAFAYKRKKISYYSYPNEHPSVILPLKYITEQKLGDVYIKDFTVRESEDDIKVFCFSHVCGETGLVSDISKIATQLKGLYNNSVVIVDGVQGFCKENINLKNVDLYSFSAHKCHGQTGLGGLYIKKGIKLSPIFFGGGQEKGVRPGTENVHGICEFSKLAGHLNKDLKRNYNHVMKIKEIIKSIANEISDVHINEVEGVYSPYILNMSFLGINGETLMNMLSEKNIYISMGTACNSKKKTKSTLELSGFSKNISISAVRFSFSILNSIDEAKYAKEIIKDCVVNLREMLRS